MISKELSATLGFAVREAKKRRHEYVSIEHILFAVLYDPTGMDIIENCGGNVENLIASLEDFFEEKIDIFIKTPKRFLLPLVYLFQSWRWL